jgi:hypothetical protein
MEVHEMGRTGRKHDEEVSIILNFCLKTSYQSTRWKNKM